jgi:hypothetical protein
VFREHTYSVGRLGLRQDDSHRARDADAISSRLERMWMVSRVLREAISKVARFEPYNRAPLLSKMKEGCSLPLFYFIIARDLMS